MRIIRDNTKVNEAELTCGSCGSLLEVQASDMTYRYLISTQERSWAFWTCGACQFENRTTVDQLPQRVKYSLRTPT